MYNPDDTQKLETRPEIKKKLKPNPTFRRRHKKSIEKYSGTVEMLEKCCLEYSDVLKNPFKGLGSPLGTDQLLNKLGSSDKILGILQCYDYFAPLSKKSWEHFCTNSVTLFAEKDLIILVEIGLNSMGQKQTHKKII